MTGSAGPHEPEALFAPGAGPRVLVMDDERSVLVVAKAALETVGCEVEVASDGSQAIEAFSRGQAEGRPYAVVILDLTVRRGLGGLDTLKRIVALDPAVRAIVTSGDSEDPVVRDHARHGFAAVLAKPFRLFDLRDVVRRVIAPVRP